MTDPEARPRVFLRPGGDRRIGGGHPWAFSNEVRMDAAAKELPPGAVVALHRVDGKPLGVGTFNPRSLIAFRMLDRDPDAVIDAAFLAGRIARALALRERLYDAPFYRLIHAEADGVPGLVVDRFADVLSVQANSAGMEALTPALLEALDAVLAPAAVVLRNDSRARAQEGLPQAVQVAKGQVAEPVIVTEAGLSFVADLVHGQKTGWYFDQRPAREMVAPLAAGGRMLDAYCQSGAFAVRAADASAVEVTAIDSSAASLDLAREAAQRNGVEAVCRFERGDVFEVLERLVSDGGRYRLVVADPPAFVKSRKDLASGIRGYRKLVRLVAPLVEPGGFLFVASCSHNVERDAFATEVAAGLHRVRRDGRILHAGGAGPDHPVHPRLPESAYLKTLLLTLD